MKAFIFLTLILSTLPFSESAIDKGSVLYSIIQSIYNRLTMSKNEVQRELSKPGSSGVIQQIIGRGFTTFKEQSNTLQFSGVEGDSLVPFLQYVSQIVNVPSNFRDSLVIEMMAVKYADLNELVETSTLYKANQGGDCKYFNFLGQRNSDNTFDFLIAEINSVFKLAENVFVIEGQKKKKLFGLIQSSEQRIVTVEKALTEDQIKDLFRYFELVAFERFSEMLKITGQSR